MNLEGWELLFSEEFRGATIHCGNASEEQGKLGSLGSREGGEITGLVQKL